MTQAPRWAIFGWILFDWACQPVATLVTTFIYAPYFASAVASSPAEGQALWGFAAAAAGIVIALTSPFVGAVADATGTRKPWIAAFGVLLILGSIGLWFGKPGDQSTIMVVLVSFTVLTIGMEFATVFNNAMMPSLVPPNKIGWLSGLGWATGYLGGLVSLVVALLFLSTNPKTGLTLIGTPPAFGLDAAAREGDRFIGPLTAIWFVVFVLPLFLLTPDNSKALKLGPAIKSGVRTTFATLREARKHKNIATFLLANMIYADGLVAMFAFGGIYAAGTFGWGAIQLGVFGILLTITGTIGALAGGRLDDKFGAKPVILGSLVLLFLSCIAILSMDRDRIFFFFPVTPADPHAGLFSSASEKLYVAIGLFIGLAAGPLQAASRALLVRLAPKEQLAQFFGLFALSGKLTSFMGPFLVATVTALTLNQKAGVSVLVLFFIAGGLLLLRVDTARRN
ncbi:MAG: MFS transporter [Xanthobacteraceae bacterium]|nr:MFS transporter [Xanthobacteraceae bacterium]